MPAPLRASQLPPRRWEPHQPRGVDEGTKGRGWAAAWSRGAGAEAPRSPAEGSGAAGPAPPVVLEETPWVSLRAHFLRGGFYCMRKEFWKAVVNIFSSGKLFIGMKRGFFFFFFPLYKATCGDHIGSEIMWPFWFWRTANVIKGLPNTPARSSKSLAFYPGHIFGCL